MEKCCEHVENHVEHIGNIKIPLNKGLVSLHFRESKAYVLTHEHVKMLHTTNQPQLSHVEEVLILHCAKCVIHFQSHGSHFQHTKMKRNMNLPMMNTLSTQNTRASNSLPLNGTGMCLLWGLTMQVPSHEQIIVLGMISPKIWGIKITQIGWNRAEEWPHCKPTKPNFVYWVGLINAVLCMQVSILCI